MTQRTTDGVNFLDPLGLWKTTRDANLDAWAKMMNVVVNSDEYSMLTGTALEQALAASQPVRDALAKVMTQMQGMLNMPTRAEVISLAERLINIELRLDDLDAKLSAMQPVLQESMRETVRQALTTPTRHLKTIETRFDEMDTRFNAIPAAVQKAVIQAVTSPAAAAPKPTTSPAAAAPKPTKEKAEGQS